MAGALLGDIARYLLAGSLVAVIGVAIGYRPAGGVFVAPRTMPGWLRAFVRLNPVSHLVAAERGLPWPASSATAGSPGSSGAAHSGPRRAWMAAMPRRMQASTVCPLIPVTDAICESGQPA